MSILGTPGSHPLVVQSLSHFWLFVTPWTAAPQASLTFTISSGLLKLTSFELVIPSNHLFLWCPLTHLLILPLIPPGELRPSPEPFWAYFGVPSTCVLSCVWLFATPWTIACQAPLSMGFSRQEYWSGLPVPSPGHPRTPCLSLPGAQDLFPESITWSLWHLSLDLLGPPFCWLETHLNLSPDPVWPTWAFQAVAACQSVGCVRLFVTLWTVARQAPLSMDSPGKNTGLGCHFLLQWIFLTQGWNSCIGRWVLYQWATGEPQAFRTSLLIVSGTPGSPSLIPPGSPETLAWIYLGLGTFVWPFILSPPGSLKTFFWAQLGFSEPLHFSHPSQPWDFHVTTQTPQEYPSTTLPLPITAKPFSFSRSWYISLIVTITLVSTFLSFLKPTINAYALNAIGLHIIYIVVQEYKKWVWLRVPREVAPLSLPRTAPTCQRKTSPCSLPQDCSPATGRTRI